jgi:hypothetical protein
MQARIRHGLLIMVENDNDGNTSDKVRIVLDYVRTYLIPTYLPLHF